MQIKTTMRYHLTSVRIAIIKKSTNNWWQECGVKRNLLHCWWECKLLQPLWKPVWRYLRKLKTELCCVIIQIIQITVWSSQPTPGHMSRQKNDSKDTCTFLFTAAVFTIAKTPWMSISRWTGKDVVCTPMEPSHTNEIKPFRSDTDTARDFHAKWSRSEKEWCHLYHVMSLICGI